MLAPRDRFVDANRLRLHLLEWGEGGQVVLLLHGFLEHAHVWDFVAPAIADRGYRVYALDWRGHGDSDRVGAGGYYHFFDYVADLAELVPQLAEQVVLVAHSMGGGAALLFAGTEPQRVRGLVSIEGLGAPDLEPSWLPDRVLSWLEDLRKAGRRRPAAVDVEAATRKICNRWATLPPEMARHIVLYGTRVEGGKRYWKFDPLHQTRAPLTTPVAYARAFWRRVACPVLYVEGLESPMRAAEMNVEERLTALRAGRTAIAGAGHHPHLERPAELAGRIVEFLGGLGA